MPASVPLARRSLSVRNEYPMRDSIGRAVRPPAVHNQAMLAALAFAAQTHLDLYTLPWIEGKNVRAEFGYTDVRSGERAVASDVAEAADGVRYVLLGETHDSADHHKMQAEVIEALVARGREVVIGFEMFTRPRQPDLEAWPKGEQTEAEFIEKSNWGKEWGFPFELYKPIFDAAKKHKLRMVALNVPRTWVRAKSGGKELPEEAKGQVPDPSLDNPTHRKLFDEMMKGHPVSEAAANNMYSAQVLWDEGMADTAIKHFKANPPGPKTVMVIVVGSGHVLYGQGINWRLKERAGEKSVSVIGVDAEAARDVKSSLGDFAYLSPPPKRG